MSVHSVSSSANPLTTAIQQQTRTPAVQGSGREAENDGDKDDGGSAVKAPTPTVNMNGQSIGALINVTA
jgi:hypothetical protein